MLAFGVISSQSLVNHELTLIPYQTAVSLSCYQGMACHIAASEQAVEDNKKGNVTLKPKSS